MGEILSNLLSITPEKGFRFRSVSSWDFPDGYRKRRGVNSPIVVLFYKDNPLGLINYTNSYFSKEIKINFLQGIKQTDSSINLNGFNKNWYEYILDSFITASLPLISKGKTISFSSAYMSRGLHISSVKTRKMQVLENNEKIEHLLRKIQELKKKPKIENNKVILSCENRIFLLKKENRYFEKVIATISSILKTQGTIRDKYFTKDGKLNFQKERVRRLVESYQKNVKPQKKSIFKIKKIIKPR